MVGPRRGGEAARTVGQRGHRGLGEGVPRIRLRDGHRLRGGPLERDVLRAEDDLHPLVELHAVARVGQAGLVEHASAPRSADVAEALEVGLLLRRDGGGTGVIAPRGQPGQGGPQVGAHARDAGRFLRGPIVRLARVLGQVEELGPGTVDQLPIAGRPRAERRPAAIETPEKALRIEGLGRKPLAAERRAKVPAGHLRWRLEPQQAEKGRCEVHGGDAARHGHARRHVGPGEEERNVQRRLVQEHGVGDLPVLSQRLTVIGQHRHHGVLLVARGAQPIDQPPELRVGECDLAVVRPARKRSPVRLRRVVRGVGVVKVHPDEERRVPRPGEPGEGGVDHVARGTLRTGARDRAVLEVLAECVEPLPEAEGGGDGVGAHEGRGAVALRLEQGGQRSMA